MKDSKNGMVTYLTRNTLAVVVKQSAFPLLPRGGYLNSIDFSE